MTLVAQGLII